ncbi:MAG: hypothetical protein V7739_15205 [Motiliproteus sp.]
MGFSNSSALLKTLIIFSLTVLAGCSHNIQVNPDLTELRQTKINSLSPHNVAYFISKEDKERQVTTPGGGGDKVSYKPYSDTEGALNTILSRIFSRVYSMKSLDDSDFIKDKKISYIFIPKLSTNSSSSSALTWPPTEFLMSLNCTAIDSDGIRIWEKTVHAKGYAEFSEFKADFSLSARRASENAFKMMLEEINNEQLFTN